MRIYTKRQKRHKIRWRKAYNQKHKYATKETEGKRFMISEMYLIWNKKLDQGKTLTDVRIAKVIQRSVQSVQLKRCKMRKHGHNDLVFEWLDLHL